MLADGGLMVEAGRTHLPWALLVDCLTGAPGMGPVLPAGFPHPQDPCTTHLTSPPEYYIRKDSADNR